MTEAGRDQLLTLIADLRANSDKRTLGIALATLAHVVKHVGTADGRPAFASAAEAGTEAVHILRETGDKAELARALRLAALPFCGLDCATMLTESLALTRELGDREQEGWTLLRMTGSDGVPGHSVEEALAAFKECGDLSGQATCLMKIGFRRPHQPELIEKAVEIFESIGASRDADVARQFLHLARGR